MTVYSSSNQSSEGTRRVSRNVVDTVSIGNYFKQIALVLSFVGFFIDI